MTLHHSTKVKLKKVLICLCVIAGAPFVSAWVIKSLPAISAAAAKAASFSAVLNFGEMYPPEEYFSSQTEASAKAEETEISLDDRIMLSEGMPYEYTAAENEDTLKTNETQSTYTGPSPYPESIETHSGTITAMAYLQQDGKQFFNLEKCGQVRNTTEIPMSKLIEESKKLPEFKIDVGDEGKTSEPQVLIMHTHTTESYEPYARDFYDASFNSRTTDETKNVVSVGNAIEKELTSQGIGVIHDKTVHDYPSYNGSYDRSRVTVKAILAAHPSIKIVLDIHRDAIERDGGERIAPTVTVDGKQAAQVMIISGCDNGTMNMPNYLKNFRFASLFQQQLEGDYPGLMRPVLFAYKKYNQDLTTGSLLIEVGGHANSIEQAQYSGELVGKSLANALKGISS